MKEQTKEVTRLYTVEDLRQFTVQATDGLLGTVIDVALAPAGWAARYFVVDTSDWLPDKQVIVPVQWINEVDWQTQVLHADVNRAAVQNGPDLPSRQDLDRAYEERLYAHYQRHPYWLDESAVDEASWESFPASDPPARW